MLSAVAVKQHFFKHNGYIDPEREKLYAGLIWERRNVSLEDLGVWDEARGLPHEWCVGNVLDTVKYIETKGVEGQFNEKIQSLLRDEPPLVIVVDGRLMRGREKCREMKWSIDDGCMRTIAHALKGFKEISCYAGMRK